MTGEHCQRTLQRLRDALASAGIELERMVLWHDLADVRWIAGFPGPVLRDDGSACSLNRERTVNGFRDAVFVKRTVMAIERAAGLPGFDAVVKHLKNWRLHPPVRRQNKRLLSLADQAGDHLYEIEVAARLAPTVAGLRFDEPDLLCEASEHSFRFGVACKRPRTASGFMRCVRKAIRQVRKEGALGVALVSVDHLINPAVRDRSGRASKDECVRRIGSVVEAHHGAVLGAMEGQGAITTSDRCSS